MNEVGSLNEVMIKRKFYQLACYPNILIFSIEITCNRENPIIKIWVGSHEAQHIGKINLRDAKPATSKRKVLGMAKFLFYPIP